MKQKVTREKVLKSIISLIVEHRSECVEEDAQLGRLHIGLQTVEWMYDWLAEEYKDAKMTKPSKDELKELLQGDTIGKLADIAMKHVEDGAEYDDGEEDQENSGNVRKTVSFVFQNQDKGGGCVSSISEPSAMTRDEFIKKCGEFYDARGTHVNDFELMFVKVEV